MANSSDKSGAVETAESLSRPQVADPSHLNITTAAADKLAHLLLVRGDGRMLNIQDCLSRSCAEPRDSATEYAISRVIGISDSGHLTLRSVRLSDDTTAYLSCFYDAVVEVFTFRGLRQIKKRWRFNAEARVGGDREADRYERTFKFKRFKQVGGGLMRGRLTPRIKKPRIITTRSLRQPRDK